MVEKTTTTAERLRFILETENIKQADILERCLPYLEQFKVKMNRSDISQYIAGKATPKQNKLYILARALNVSEAWLMGYNVDKERQERAEPSSPAAARLNVLDPLPPAIQELRIRDKKREIIVEIETTAAGMNERQLGQLLDYAKMLKSYKGD